MALTVPTFYIWFVTYGTYADPDVAPKVVAGPMSLGQALRESHNLGFGYCVKEHK